MTNPAHYPSLELCKKLTEIGFPKTENFMKSSYGHIYPKDYKGIMREEFYTPLPCPSVMEMLDLIPAELTMRHEAWESALETGLELSKTSVSYVFYDWGDRHETMYFAMETLPNALAEMLLWLHENKHISFIK